jgi:DNA-binding PadR family transcriptional regulator
MKPTSSKTAPLSPAILHILFALAGSDLHGYGIIQEVRRHSDGHYRLGAGTLYDNLKKLMDTGWVADAAKSASPVEDDRRFYTLTAQGRNALRAEVGRLEEIVTEARVRLGGRRSRRI